MCRIIILIVVLLNVLANNVSGKEKFWYIADPDSTIGFREIVALHDSGKTTAGISAVNLGFSTSTAWIVAGN